VKINLAVLNDQEIMAWIRPWCDKAERSPSDVLKRLLRNGLDKDHAEHLLHKLVAEKMVDPIRFAQAFAHDHFHFNKWGKNKIKAALYAKGIGRDEIQMALEQIDPSDERQEILQLIAKKKMPDSADQLVKWRASLIRSLLQKGFNATDVFSCIKEFVANNDVDSRRVR
jgi:regulatory protein